MHLIIDNKVMSNVLVTGGAGFIGSHLCEALTQQGYAVTCIDNLSTGTLKNLDGCQGIEFIQADVNRWNTFKRLRARRYDAVFHYAATVGVRMTEENPRQVLSDVQGINNIERFAREGRAGKIIFASSSEIYGQSRRQPLREQDGHSAWSPYTAVKMYGEHLFQSLWQKDSIPTVSLRFFNVYGTRQRGSGYGFVTAKFIEQAASGRPLTIYGDGQQTRDFVYIEDNIAVALSALHTEHCAGKVTNVGTGKETSVNELARAVLRAAGKQDAVGMRHLRGRHLEIRRRCADTKQMQGLLKIKCATSLKDGLAKTINQEELILEHSAIPALA